MSRIYHYDTTYEQEAEDGTVTASVELRIYFTATFGGEDSADGPGWDAEAEFHSVGAEIGSTRQYRELKPSDSTDMQAIADDALYWWSYNFIDSHQAELLEAAERVLDDEREHAREMRDEMRREIG